MTNPEPDFIPFNPEEVLSPNTQQTAKAKSEDTENPPLPKNNVKPPPPPKNNLKQQQQQQQQQNKSKKKEKQQKANQPKQDKVTRQAKEPKKAKPQKQDNRNKKPKGRKRITKQLYDDLVEMAAVGFNATKEENRVLKEMLLQEQGKLSAIQSEMEVLRAAKGLSNAGDAFGEAAAAARGVGGGDEAS